MSRRFTFIAAALTAMIIFPASGRADDANDAPSIPLNQDHTGSMDGSKKNTPGFTNYWYESASTVQLLGGHNVTVQLHVLGSGRNAVISVCDSTGTCLDSARPQEKTNTLKIDELPYTGKYTVYVGSDRIGDYTLRVESEEHDTADSVQAKIDSLKQQLAELEEKLKKLQEK